MYHSEGWSYLSREQESHSRYSVLPWWLLLQEWVLHLNNCTLWAVLNFVLIAKHLDFLSNRLVALRLTFYPSIPSFTFLLPSSKVHRLQDQLAPRAHWTQVLESQPWQQPSPAVPTTSRTSQSKAAITFALVRWSPSIGRPRLGRWLEHHW